MSIQSTNNCPSLLQITSYYQIVEFPQKVLCGEFKEKDDALFCIKSLWDAFRNNAAFLGLNHIMKDIEISLINECSREFKILSVNLTPDYKETLLVNNVKMLFEKLANELGVPIDTSDWSLLQEMWEDESLVLLWNNGIWPRLSNMWTKPTTAEEIRTWLTDPENAIHLGDWFQGLGLHNSAAKAVPPEIINFTHLKGINLNDDKIKFVPEFLRNIPTLEYINLRKNHICGIPDSTFKCKFLTDINLSENRISIIPGAISKLTTLKILNLSYNKITMIPDGISKLTNLEELDLHRNKIVCTLSSLVPLKKLHSLGLGHNPLPLHFDDVERFGSKFLKCLSIGGEKKDLALIQTFLAKVEALNKYKCTGSYSNFIRKALQAYSEGRHDLIKQAFQDLCDLDKDLICEAYFSAIYPKHVFKYPHDHEVWKNDKLFGNIDTFCLAIVKAIEIKYEILSDNQKEFVDTQLGKQDLNNNWLLKSDLIEDLGKFDLK